MEQWIIMTAILTVIIALAGSALAIGYVIYKSRQREAEVEAAGKDAEAARNVRAIRMKWKLILAFYLSLCLIFSGIILYQSAQGMEERALDCTGVLAGAVFFIIQACSCRKQEVLRARATVRTAGTLVRTVYRMDLDSDSNRRDSVFEFYADGVRQEVTARGLYGVEKGGQVTLYYNPDYPQVFYIPRERGLERAAEVILFLFGAVFPIVGLAAPFFR